MRDSTATKRPAPKKRPFKGMPYPVQDLVGPVVEGFGELKRQSGIAVDKVREGYRKIKQSIGK